MDPLQGRILFASLSVVALTAIAALADAGRAHRRAKEPGRLKDLQNLWTTARQQRRNDAAS